MLRIILFNMRLKLYTGLLSLANNTLGVYSAYGTLLLLSTAIIIIVSNIWETWHPQQQTSSAAPLAVPPPCKTLAYCPNYETIRNAALFGKQLPSNLRTIPLSAAKLKLQGLIYSTQASASPPQAIIQAHGVSKIYTIGDNITATIKITLITAHYVLLDNNKHWELLQL